MECDAVRSKTCSNVSGSSASRHGVLHVACAPFVATCRSASPRPLPLYRGYLLAGCAGDSALSAADQQQQHQGRAQHTDVGYSPPSTSTQRNPIGTAASPLSRRPCKVVPLSKHVRRRRQQLGNWFGHERNHVRPYGPVGEARRHRRSYRNGLALPGHAYSRWVCGSAKAHHVPTAKAVVPRPGPRRSQHFDSIIR